MASERLMTIFRSATHQGELAEATHRGVAGIPGCGPYIMLAFRVDDGIVKTARFQTYGCPTAMACAEIVCRMSEGRPVARLPPVTPADLDLLVGGVPEGKEHCPMLAVEALARMAPMCLGARSPPRLPDLFVNPRQCRGEGDRPSTVSG